MQPSRNQKQRSRLKQLADSTNAVPPPAAAPAPPPPSPPPPAPAADSEPLIRRMRLKRTGQPREDLFLPDDAQPAKREDEY
jgi:hypothetical protein